jgi:hypothetical protein
MEVLTTIGTWTGEPVEADESVFIGSGVLISDFFEYPVLVELGKITCKIKLR